MCERIAVVTGATSGIGKEIARALARDHRVGVVCRDPARGAALVAEFAAEMPDADLETFLADLSVRADVRRVARRLTARYGRLDVLVNNAGVQRLRGATGPDGLDLMIATNHLGPFLLTNLLLDAVRAAGRARIVVVASEAHRFAGRVDLDRFAEPGDYGLRGALRVYARSKLFNILFTQELARRLAGTRVTANALCPGLAATGLVRESLPRSERTASLVARTPLMRTAGQAARLAVRLATEAAFEGRSGGFYSSMRGVRNLPPVAARRDAALQRNLWARSAELTGLSGR
ncbi:SDR family NAD(P)-dependent oxidoreductase [Actinomadura meyerae]|uniref:SDR family NAD(P)-dependent oxidoreductase n=1 Tax=Actinomadura meyerae TaxID=240840 RepID=UPI000B7881BD|nr:SDR family NAD(P)-dependent oxidoreductase [Actinomadura meyerae]